jgi:hypothetical protein
MAKSQNILLLSSSATAGLQAEFSMIVVAGGSRSASHPGTSRFHRSAIYTGCYRSAAAPRRPTTGPVLSMSPKDHLHLVQSRCTTLSIFQQAYAYTVEVAGLESVGQGHRYELLRRVEKDTAAKQPVLEPDKQVQEFFDARDVVQVKDVTLIKRSQLAVHVRFQRWHDAKLYAATTVRCP